MPRVFRPTRLQLRRAGLLTREGPGDPLMKRTLPGSGSSSSGGGGGSGETNTMGTGTTTDDVTPVVLVTLPLVSNGTYFLEARYTGRVTNVGGTFGRGASILHQLFASVKRVDGGAAVVSGTQTAAFVVNEGADGTPDVVASGNSVQVIITGAGLGDTIDWKVSVNSFFV